MSKELIDEINERYHTSMDMFRIQRELMVSDINFSAGYNEGIIGTDQWDSDVRSSRTASGKPVYTINRIPQLENQIINDFRQRKPKLKALPVGGESTERLAKIFQGLFRSIENNSNANSVYDTAVTNAIRCGMGFIRLTTEYSDDYGFNQCIKIKRELDPLSYLLDPYAIEQSFSDMDYCFHQVNMDKKEFEKKYGKSAQGGYLNMEYNITSAGWCDSSRVRILEYYKRDWIKEKVVLVVNPNTGKQETIKADELDPALREFVIAEKKIEVPKVKWYKYGGNDILEEADWAGRYIPIIPVLGLERVVQETKVYESCHRHSKDTQRLANLLRSTEAEALSMIVKAPMMIGESQMIDKYTDVYINMNTENYSAIPYADNKNPNPPQRMNFNPDLQAIYNAKQYADEDFRATSGLHESSYGQQGNEDSAVAIHARKQQGDKGSYHFIDNFYVAYKHLGDMIVDLIPKIYDAEQVINIMSDEAYEDIKINDPQDPNSIDLTKAKFKIVVDSSANFSTKKQENRATLTSLLQNPNSPLQAASYYLAKDLDTEYASDIAAIVKAQLPQPIQDIINKREGKVQEQDQQAQLAQQMQQAQQQLQEAQQTITQLTQELDAQTAIIQGQIIANKSKEFIASMEIEAKLKSDKINIEKDILIKQMDVEQKNHQASVSNAIKMTDSLNAYVADAEAKANELQQKAEETNLEATETPEHEQVEPQQENMELPQQPQEGI